MGLLDWIRNRNKPNVPDEFDPRAHGHASWKEVFAEMHGDERLAKQRDETGREPENRTQKAKPGRSQSWDR
jgi:hypothetical protein